jgi:hypothetical protein
MEDFATMLFAGIAVLAVLYVPSGSARRREYIEFRD